MNTHTDDEVTRLLAQAFAEHEHLATADGLANAVDLSRRGPSRRRTGWLVAAAAAAVLAAGAGAAWVAGGPGTGATQAPAASTSPGLTSRATAAELRAATEQAVEEAVQAVRMPAGADEFPRDDPPDGQQPGSIRSKSRYWSVPGTVDSVTAALVDAPPPGLSGSVGAGLGPTSRGVQYWDPKGSTGPADEVTTWLNVGATDHADEVRVLAWAESTPRPARPAASFVDEPVESIDVTMIRPADFGSPTTEHLALTDPAAIQRVVGALNGAFAVPEPKVECSPSPLIEDRAVLHTASRDIGLVLSYSCPGGVHLTDTDVWLQQTSKIASLLGNELLDHGVTQSPS